MNQNFAAIIYPKERKLIEDIQEELLRDGVVRYMRPSPGNTMSPDGSKECCDRWAYGWPSFASRFRHCAATGSDKHDPDFKEVLVSGMLHLPMGAGDSLRKFVKIRLVEQGHYHFALGL
jgi:hypothetical protein